MPDSGFVFSPAFRVATADMDVVAGGSLEFYQANTNTATDVYSDSTLLTSLGSVVYLDSGGHPVASSGSSTKVIVYTGASLIKIIVKDADGATLATYDNVRCAQDTSALSGGGSDGGVEAVVSKTSDYTVLVADDGKLLHCDPTGGAFSITLPSSVTAGDGFEVGIRHAGTTTTNTVKIATVSSQTIARGASTSTATTVKRGGETLRLVSNGSNWVAYGDTGPDFNESPIRITDRLASPPASTTAGARYLISSSPTLGWSSYAAGDIVEADGNGGWIRYRPYTDCGWLAYIIDENLIAQYQDSAWVDLDVASPTPSTIKRALFTEQQTANTAPTALTGTAWTKSALNTEVVNTITGATLSSSVITLPAGAYIIMGWRALYFSGGSSSAASGKIRLRDTTAGVSYVGPNAFSQNSTASTVATYYNVPFFFTVTPSVETTYELQYYVGSNFTGGVQLNLGSEPEVYTQVEVVDLSSLQGPKGDPGDPEYLVYPEHFGAVADGVTDDSGAFQDALNYLISDGGGTLMLRDRTYRIKADISPDNITGVESIAIVGAGPRSVLDFSDAITVGLSLNSTSTTVNQRPRFKFSDFRIITSKKDAGTAISVSYADDVYAHDSVTVDGVEITQNVSRLSDSGADYGYWSAGFVFNNVRNATLTRWSFSGEMDLASDTAYGLRLIGGSIGVRCTDFRVQEATTAISVEDTSEGLYVSDYEIVTCRVGIRWNVSSGAEPVLSSVNGHITTANNGIYATSVVFGQISNTNFYAASGLDTGTWPTYYGILVDGANSQQWQVTGCSFSKESGRTGDTTVGVQFSTGVGYRIVGNNFYGLSGNTLTFAIIASSGVDDVFISANGYTNVSVPITSTGATNVTINDHIMQHKAGALALSNGANSNVDVASGVYQRISGPTGAFSISGFLAPAGGARELIIHNSTAQDMTLTNDATSTAANRILTLTGADVTLTGVSAARFVYSPTDSRWILVGTQG